jgi:hypothetical protein
MFAPDGEDFAARGDCAAEFKPEVHVDDGGRAARVLPNIA